MIAETDPRYMSFNIEMAEVTGGEFWAPYTDVAHRRLAPRPPIDLSDPRLIILARDLVPSMIRVSGTWANGTYVPAPNEAAPTTPPPGFRQVLKQDRWRGLVKFANAVGMPLLLSFPASGGTRDAEGNWLPEQAERLVALTRAFGGRITAVEFINEPNLVKLGRLPDGYNAAAYARDFATFRRFAERALPGVPVLGHSGSGRGGDITTADIAKAAAGMIDGVSYHFYGALSPRCVDSGNQVEADEALSEEWLTRTEKDYEYFAGLRDVYDPGKPIWLTETAQAACGGSPWAATFRDSFRFVDQLGRLARHGVRIVAHNTLAAGDYALVDGKTRTPRPNYWVAWLWQQRMGPRVLDALAPTVESRHLYAHCLTGTPGGVALVAISLRPSESRIALDGPAKVWVVEGDSLDASTVRINGRIAALAGDKVVPIPPVVVRKGGITLPGHSIAFVELPGAANRQCP